MSTSRNEYTVAIHRCGEELSPRCKEPLFEIATAADLPSLLQRYLTACAVLADEVDGRLLDDPVSAYDAAAGAIAEAIVFGHWLHVSDEMKRRAFVARADIALDARTREVMHLVDHVTWGDIDGSIESIVEVLTPALQGTVEDLERWEHRPSAEDEFSLTAKDVRALPPEEKVAYLTRVLTTVALHLGVSTVFGERTIGHEDHDRPSLTGLLRALLTAVQPHDTREISECNEAESCAEGETPEPPIRDLYTRVRHHPDYVFGTIFVPEDFDDEVVPESFDAGRAINALVEAGFESIASQTMPRRPMRAESSEEQDARSDRFAALRAKIRLEAAPEEYAGVDPVTWAAWAERVKARRAASQTEFPLLTWDRESLLTEIVVAGSSEEEISWLSEQDDDAFLELVTNTGDSLYETGALGASLTTALTAMFRAGPPA